MLKLGILGGMGPLATTRFMEMVIRHTDASRDQEHIDMLVYNRPSIPDRTAFLCGRSQENPLPVLTETAQALEAWGADVLAMPCVTAHNFYQGVQAAVNVPFLHIMEETAAYLQARGIRRAGLLATDGTVSTGLFQKALEQRGIACILPDAQGQQTVMDVIYKQVKAGGERNLTAFLQTAQSLHAEMCILGCTELSLLTDDLPKGQFADAMEILAMRAVEACGGTLLKGV